MRARRASRFRSRAADSTRSKSPTTAAVFARDELALAVARHATSKLRDAGGPRAHRDARLSRRRPSGDRGGRATCASCRGSPARTSPTRSTPSRDSVERARTRRPRRSGTRVDRPRSLRERSGPARVHEVRRAPSSRASRLSSPTLALAYPRRGVRLRHDGREVFALEAGAHRRSGSHTFSGTRARSLIPIEPHESPYAAVRGFVNAPGSERGDRRLQLAFVNDRLLRTTQFAGAWTAAYATFAMQQRHAFGVLFVDVPPAEVDPNVHPTKFDVRFRAREHVYDAVRRGVTRTLEAYERERFASSVSLAPPVPGCGLVPAQAAADATRSAASRIALRAAAAALRVVAHVDRTYIVATDGRR